MATDVTSIFRRIVHELETRPEPEGAVNGDSKSRILKPSKTGGSIYYFINILLRLLVLWTYVTISTL